MPGEHRPQSRSERSLRVSGRVGFGARGPRGDPIEYALLEFFLSRLQIELLNW